MKLKKRAMALLCLVLALTLPLGAFAQSGEKDTELEGFVSEVLEDGFLMEDVELGQVMLNVSDATVYDGALLENELAVGQYVIVQYNGRLTRSLPPQAHADRVGCYVLTGVSAGMAEPGLLTLEVEELGQVLVHLGSDVPPVYDGVPVTVYYDGVMTMSLPGQISARYVVVPQLQGLVSQLDGEGFTLTGEDGVEYRVLVSDETLIGQLVAVEETEDADGQAAAQAEEDENGGEGSSEAGSEASSSAASGESKPQESAQPEENAPAEAAGGLETASEADAASDPGAPEGFDAADESYTLLEGDLVTVYYNGMLTKSIPAQLTALEVLVHKAEDVAE